MSPKAKKRPPRYLGSWVLPSGNSCDVYLSALPQVGALVPGLECRWDIPPSPAWPADDVAHYESVTFPEIVRAVALATGQRVLGVTL
jgi:hypothetical protein